MTSTPSYISLLGNFSAQVLPNSPALWKVRVDQRGSTTSSYYQARIKLTKMELSWTTTGSEGTALAAADLFNRVRLCFFYTDVPYGDSPLNPLTDVTSFCELQDVNQVYCDWKAGLPSQAFNSGDYNAPAIASGSKVFNINKVLEWKVRGTPTSNYWYTLRGNVLFAMVSDSSATPHPQIQFNSRIHYVPMPYV